MAGAKWAEKLRTHVRGRRRATLHRVEGSCRRTQVERDLAEPQLDARELPVGVQVALEEVVADRMYAHHERLDALWQERLELKFVGEIQPDAGSEVWCGVVR